MAGKYAPGWVSRIRVAVAREIRLGERFSDGNALRQQEGVRHAATDDQHVDLLDQVLQEIELGRHLGAADDGGHRTLGGFERLGKRIELRLHAAPGIGRELVAEPLGRGMRPMCRRERVVHPEIAEPGKRGGELGVVLLLAFVEARVFEAEDVAGLHRGDGGFGGSADAIVDERHRPFDDLRDGSGDRPQRLLRIAALRPPEMREQDHLAALVGDLGDGRAVPLDSGRVGDLAVLHRDVEIDAQQHALAANVDVIKRVKRCHDLYRPMGVISTSPLPSLSRRPA